MRSSTSKLILTLSMWLGLSCSRDAPSVPPNGVLAGAAAPNAGATGAGAAADSGRGDAGSSGSPQAGAGGAAGAGAAGMGATAAIDAGMIVDDASRPDAGKPTRYDYVNDVQPIVTRYCVSCHGPSNVAPFRLDSYVEVRDAAPQCAGAITARIMPPCENMPADCSRPTSEETAIFVEWAASSRPELLEE